MLVLVSLTDRSRARSRLTRLSFPLVRFRHNLNLTCLNLCPRSSHPSGQRYTERVNQAEVIVTALIMMMKSRALVTILFSVPPSLRTRLYPEAARPIPRVWFAALVPVRARQVHQRNGGLSCASLTHLRVYILWIYSQKQRLTHKWTYNERLRSHFLLCILCFPWSKTFMLCCCLLWTGRCKVVSGARCERREVTADYEPDPEAPAHLSTGEDSGCTLFRPPDLQTPIPSRHYPSTLSLTAAWSLVPIQPQPCTPASCNLQFHLWANLTFYSLTRDHILSLEVKNKF